MGDPNCEWDWDNQDQARWRNSRPIGHPGECGMPPGIFIDFLFVIVWRRD